MVYQVKDTVCFLYKLLLLWLSVKKQLNLGRDWGVEDFVPQYQHLLELITPFSVGRLQGSAHRCRWQAGRRRLLRYLVRSLQDDCPQNPGDSHVSRGTPRPLMWRVTRRPCRRSTRTSFSSRLTSTSARTSRPSTASRACPLSSTSRKE